MPIEMILPLGILIGLINFSLIARWWLLPKLSALPRKDALTPLLLFHAFRYVGMALLIPGIVAPTLAMEFAAPAGYGDLLAALLALLALAALRLHWPLATGLVWVFNIVGFVDLVVALVLRVRFVETGELSGVYLMPAVYIPALIVTHVVIFRLLTQAQTQEAQRQNPQRLQNVT